MRSPTKILRHLGTAVRLDPDNDAAIGQLCQEYKAARCGEYLKKLVASLPPLTPGQIAVLQDILAGRVNKAKAGASNANARPTGRAGMTGNDSTGPNTTDVEYRNHGRTQWDAMTEAISSGRFRAAKLALLISVRYWPSTGAGLAVACKLIEMIGQHR